MPSYRTGSSVYATQIIHQGTKGSTSGGIANTGGMGSGMQDKRVEDIRWVVYLGVSQPNVDEYLIQNPSLDIQDGIQVVSSDNVDLTQHCVLSVDNATSDQSVESPTLTVELIVANDTQAQSVDNITVVAHVPSYILEIQDSVQNHASKMIPDSRIVSLLHFNGSEASQTITDEVSGHNWTAYKEAQITQTTKEFGNGSLALDGDDLVYDDEWDCEFSENDFTIHAWVWRNGQHTAPGIITNNGLDVHGFSLGLQASYDKFRFDAENAIRIEGDIALVNSRWTHIAVTRHNDTVRMFVDGVKEANEWDATGVSITSDVSGTRLGVMKLWGSYPWFGGIDELIIYNGVALWIDDFDVPTAEYEYGERADLYLTWLPADVPELVVQDATQAQSSDNTVLTQHNVLVVADSTQTQSVDSILLVVNMIVADALEEQTADNVGLIQHNILVTAGVLQLHNSGSPDLVQHNLLVVQDSTNAVSSQSPDLIQHNLLAVDTSAQPQTSSDITLGGIDVVPDSPTQTQTSDNVDLIQHYVLVVADTIQAQTSEVPTLVQHYVLVVNDPIQTQLADSPILGVGLIVANCLQEQVANSGSITNYTFTDGNGGDVQTYYDTFVTSLSPDVNNGTTITLENFYGAYQKRILIKFDLSSIPDDATINSAVLSLFLSGVQGNNIVVTANSILAANSSWTELGATWNHTDGTNHWAGDAGQNGGSDAGCTVSGTDFNGTALGSVTLIKDAPANTQYDISFNTGQVTAWLTENYGIVLSVPISAISGNFRSSDYVTDGTKRPKLVINYSIVVPGDTVLTQHNILVVQDATQTQTADNTSLGIGLTVANTVQATSSDTPTLVEHITISVNNAQQTQIVEGVDLTQHNILSLSNSLQVQLSDNNILVQHNVLAVDNSLQSQITDTPTLIQHYFIPAVDNSVQLQTPDNVDLTQHNILAITNSIQLQTVDSPILGVSLILGNAQQVQTVDSPALIQHNVLSIENATHLSSSDEPTLRTGNQIATQDPIQEQIANNIDLVQHNILPLVNDALQTHLVESPILVQHYILSINDSVQVQTSSSPTLVQHYSLLVDNCVQTQVTGSPTLTQHNILVTQNSAQTQTSDLLTLTQHATLVVGNSTQTQIAGNTILVPRYVLVIDDAIQLQTSEKIAVLWVRFVLNVNNTLSVQSVDNTVLIQHCTLVVNNSSQEIKSDEAEVIPLAAQLEVQNALMEMVSTSPVTIVRHVGGTARITETLLYRMTVTQVLVGVHLPTTVVVPYSVIITERKYL